MTYFIQHLIEIAAGIHSKNVMSVLPALVSTGTDLDIHKAWQTRKACASFETLENNDDSYRAIIDSNSDNK